MNSSTKLFLLALIALPQFTLWAGAETTEATEQIQVESVAPFETIENSPATLFFFSQVDKASAKKTAPIVMEFGDTVHVNSGGSTGLPASSPALSPY